MSIYSLSPTLVSLSILAASGDYQYILQGYANAANTIVLRVQFKYTGSAYQLRAKSISDTAVEQSTTYVTISDATHYIEVDWQASSAAGANDGHLTFWIDGVQQGNITGIDNDTYRMERGRIGVVYIVNAGTNGTEYFDAFESRRSTYIGPLAYNPMQMNILPVVYRFQPLLQSAETPTPTETPTLDTWNVTPDTPTPTPDTFSPDTSELLTSALAASFLYDGDTLTGTRGKRVQSTIRGVTTNFVGNYYEVTGSVVTKYYYAGSQRIAMRVNGTLYFMLGDHLGSTSLTTDANGVVQSELRYKAWGEVRYSSGMIQSGYTYTGQYSNVSDFGLMFYNARWYDVLLGRFAQADMVIPDPSDPQSWNIILSSK